MNTIHIWLKKNGIGLILRLVLFSTTQVGDFVIKVVLLALDLLGDLHPAVFLLDNGAL